jgi:hypothetical protein
MRGGIEAQIAKLDQLLEQQASENDATASAA